MKQYWEESPFLAVVYRKAYKLRRETENEQAWLQGLYFYYSVAVCFANAFSKRGMKKQNYFEQPLDIFPLTEEEKKRREKAEMLKMQEAMKAIARKQRQKKGEK